MTGLFRREMTPRRYRLRSTAPTVLWWVMVAFLVLIVLYPLAMLFYTSLKTGEGIGFSNYAAILSDPVTLRSFGNTVRVVVPVTLLSTVLGVFLAWAVTRTDLPGRRLWKSLLAVPYLIPPFVGAIAWTFLLGPVGFFNRLWMTLTGAAEPLVNIYGIGGMIFVMTMYRYAVPYVVVLPAMKKINSAVEEAARVSGANPWRTLRDITLPLLTPSIVGSMLMVFLFCLADFGVPAVLGAPDQIRLMSTQIYYLVGRTDLGNSLYLAAAYSVLMCVVGVLGLMAYNRVVGSNKYVVVSGKSALHQITRLRGARWAIFAFVLLIFAVSTLSPIAATVVIAFTRVFGLPFGSGNITLQNFARLLSIRNIRRAFGNSAFLAIASAAIIMVIGLAVAYVAIRGARRRLSGIRLTQLMATVPYSIPGVVIALGMILAFKQPILGIRLYGTIWILLIAYVARFLNLGYNNISGAISQIDPSLEEASRICGASHLTTFRRIMLPILRPSLYGSFFLVVAPTLSELSLSSLLWSAGNETIGTVVFSSQEQGKILITAALAVTLILLVVLANFLVRKISGDKMGV